MKLYSVAIDGPSGAGKSTIARAAAKRFGFLYVDTGAIYRTVGLAAERAGVKKGDRDAVTALLSKLDISLGYGEDGVQRSYLNGEDVSEAIRTPEISSRASDVSAMPEVRACLLEMQRAMARKHSVIMDGRDIGSVVLPDADLKIFLTASAECRAERRRDRLRAAAHAASQERLGLVLGHEDARDAQGGIRVLPDLPDGLRQVADPLHRVLPRFGDDKRVVAGG